MTTVAICICTYMREGLLGECLDSIADMQAPSDLDVQVVVIDNDASASSSPLVSKRRETFPFQLSYVCEPKRGIPCARNRAIVEAQVIRSDYLVFIDDDERVAREWLVILFDYCQQKGGRAVIHGGVEPVLPPTAPAHLRALYQKNKRKTGDRLNACATNNVIVPVWLTTELGLRFDESNPLAGGTDTIFFTQAVAQGVEIFECSEALVRETIPASRVTLSWWSKRKYRAGITEAWRKRQAGRSMVSILISALMQVVIESVKAIILMLVGQWTLRNRCWLKACRSAGVFAGVFGAQVDSYKQIDS